MANSKNNINRRKFLQIGSGSMAAMLLSEKTINAGEVPKDEGPKKSTKNTNDKTMKNTTGRRAKSSVRVALIRSTPAAGDMSANWATFEHFARQGADEKADICISPECFLDGYAVAHADWSRERLIEGGRTAAKEYLPRLKKLACELKIMLLFGTVYTTGRYCYNSAFLIGADGKEVGRYDKTHLLDHDLRFDGGQKLSVFDTPFGTVGIMICADRRWPETARTLRVQGAQLILNPTYGMKGLKNEWWMRTRSYENECYICFTHPTVSLVTDPWGNIHAKESGKEPGLLVTDIEISNIPTEMFDARRPQLYAPITRIKQ